MVDGQGDPNTSQEFADAVGVLFALSYTLKFMAKKGQMAIDYGVLPLEGLWWADDMSAFADGDKSRWKWTSMIMQPDFVTKEMVGLAIADVKKKKLPALPNVRFEPFSEGICAQIMHIGPFSEEGPTIEKVHRFIVGCGCKRTGKHHEIYLSDIGRRIRGTGRPLSGSQCSVLKKSRRFSLTAQVSCTMSAPYPCGSPLRATGKTVRVRRGPAAVTGDKGRLMSLSG